MIYGGAWSHPDRTHLHKELGFDWWFSNNALLSLSDGTFIPVARPTVDPDGYDWDRDIMQLPFDYDGYVLFGNEWGLISQGGVSPVKAVGMLIDLIRKYPKVKWIGPNTVSWYDKMTPAERAGLVVQKDWLETFIKQWLRHGYPLTGRKQPMTIGVHIYPWQKSSGKNHAQNYLTYVKRVVEAPRTIRRYDDVKEEMSWDFKKVWITEMGNKNPNRLVQWMDSVERNPDVDRCAIFIPWLKRGDKYEDYACYVGSNEEITPLGQAVKSFIKGN